MSRVRVYHGFDELPSACAELFESGSSVFLTLPWFSNLASAAFDASRRVRVYVLHDAHSGEPLMALPMCHAAPGKRPFSLSRLEAAANYYSSFFAPVFRDKSDCTQANLNLLAQAVADDVTRWDTVNLAPMDAQSPLLEGLMTAFRQAGMAVQSYFCFGNWYLDVDGRSYQDYLASRPSRLRNTLARKSRQLGANGKLRMEIISSDNDASAGIAAYQKVYDASWKKSETFPGFVASLIRTCAREGWLRLGIAYVDNKPAAAQLWIVHQGVASIYKLAYDERFSKLSVGTILTAHMMQHVIDVDKVREVDYLTGDDYYKADWMSARRERWGMAAFNLRTVAGALLAFRHLGGHALKKALRRPRAVLQREA